MNSSKKIVQIIYLGRLILEIFLRVMRLRKLFLLGNPKEDYQNSEEGKFHLDGVSGFLMAFFSDKYQRAWVVKAFVTDGKIVAIFPF